MRVGSLARWFGGSLVRWFSGSVGGAMLFCRQRGRSYCQSLINMHSAINRRIYLISSRRVNRPIRVSDRGLVAHGYTPTQSHETRQPH